MFSFKWLSFHKIITVNGVVVKLRELVSGREYVTHYDRLSNFLVSGKIEFVCNLEANSNSVEYAEEPEDDISQ